MDQGTGYAIEYAMGRASSHQHRVNYMVLPVGSECSVPLDDKQTGDMNSGKTAIRVPKQQPSHPKWRSIRHALYHSAAVVYNVIARTRRSSRNGVRRNGNPHANSSSNWS